LIYDLVAEVVRQQPATASSVFPLVVVVGRSCCTSLLAQQVLSASITHSPTVGQSVILLLARVGPAPTGCVQHTQQLLLSLWQQQSLQSLKSRICNRFGQ